MIVGAKAMLIIHCVITVMFIDAPKSNKHKFQFLVANAVVTDAVFHYISRKNDD